MKVTIEADDLNQLRSMLNALEGYDLKVSYGYGGLTLTSRQPTDELLTAGRVAADLRKISDAAPDAHGFDLQVRQYINKLETGEEPF